MFASKCTVLVFFFQAVDGIRDIGVTGVHSVLFRSTVFKNITTEYSENKKNDDILSFFECTTPPCLPTFLDEFCTLNKPEKSKIKCIANGEHGSKGGSEMIKNIEFIPDIAPGKDDFISVINKNNTKRKKKIKTKKKIYKQKRRTK